MTLFLSFTNQVRFRNNWDLFDDVDSPPLEDAEEIAAREGESEETSKAKKRAALLDDVPHSIKKNLATVSAPAPPHGYFWNGECLIKKKGNSRPDSIDNMSWKNMSKRQRAEAVVEHEQKVQAVYEAEYEAAVNAVPAMPVLIGKDEGHRERLLPLLHKKPLEVSSDMYAVVAKVLSPKEVSTNPAAQAALDKEWQKLVDKGCWVEKKAREYEAVASEAKKDNAKVHFGNIFEIGTLKGAELKEGDPNRKYKGRSVFQGNKVVDENSDHALFAEMSSSPASMEAGKILDVFGSQPGYTIQQADAKQAYTQALFTGVATWVRLPRNRWPKAWKGMKDPVVPLKLALYGHPDSGGIWEKHCETQLKKVGFEAVLTDIWKSVFYHPVKKLLLVVYVDDFKLAGPKDNIKEGWKTISSVIDMDPPEDIGRYFGCMHRHEHGLMLPKDAHPFRHVFEPESKTATLARTEDYWDIDPENLLAVRHHNYPRRRLYVPNEDDARIFPTISPRRYTVVAKSDKCISDNSNDSRDRNLKEWWSGETYFDLAGRDKESFELAVAATRKGKPIRNKSEAKKEVKQSKFVTPSQDQKEKPGVMFKPVTRVMYDMKDFLDSCVDRYCELAKVDRKTLKPAATPFHEHRTARPIIGEEEKAGRLQPIASRVLMKILFAARVARWDLLRATQSLASRVTKWSPDCDLGLHRLVCYINSSTDVTMSGFIGDSIMDCRLWLFSDSDFAGEFDSKSTTGCSMFLVGPNTYFPLNALVRNRPQSP